MRQYIFVFIIITTFMACDSGGVVSPPLDEMSQANVGSQLKLESNGAAFSFTEMSGYQIADSSDRHLDFDISESAEFKISYANKDRTGISGSVKPLSITPPAGNGLKEIESMTVLISNDYVYDYVGDDKRSAYSRYPVLEISFFDEDSGYAGGIILQETDTDLKKTLIQPDYDDNMGLRTPIDFNRGIYHMTLTDSYGSDGFTAVTERTLYLSNTGDGGVNLQDGAGDLSITLDHNTNLKEIAYKDSHHVLKETRTYSGLSRGFFSSQGVPTIKAELSSDTGLSYTETVIPLIDDSLPSLFPIEGDWFRVSDYYKGDSPVWMEINAAPPHDPADIKTASLENRKAIGLDLAGHPNLKNDYDVIFYTPAGKKEQLIWVDLEIQVLPDRNGDKTQTGSARWRYGLYHFTDTETQSHTELIQNMDFIDRYPFLLSEDYLSVEEDVQLIIYDSDGKVISDSFINR